MEDDKEINIKCRYKLPQDDKEYFGEINYKNGTLINFSTQNYNFSISKGENLLCLSNENKYILLCNNQYYESYFSKIAGFDCLVKGFNFPEQTTNLKFKKIRFSFPYINDFFIGIDRIEQFDKHNPHDIFLRYIQTKQRLTFRLNNIFKLKLIHGVTSGGGTLAGENSKMSLTKSIEISANKNMPIEDFLSIIRNLINFFSLGLKRKLPIISMTSNCTDNTAKCKLTIYPFQFKILNQDFESNLSIHKTLFVFQHIKRNFSSIMQEFINLQSQDYRKFSVIIDLYLRNHDTPDEIYPQIKFLVYAQALEAYLNSKDYNHKKEISKEFLKIVAQIKKQHSDIPEVKNCNLNGMYSFKEKILNSIKKNDVENILKFKFIKAKKIKLLEDTVNLRNYFTHYSMASDDKKIANVDVYDLTENLKALLELFILKDLQFNNEAIRVILANNYFHFKNFNSEYIWIPQPPNLRNVIKENYLGDETSYYNENKKLILSTHYFYENIEDKIKLIVKYSEEGRYCQHNKSKLKSLTKTIIINPDLSKEENNKLDKPLRICYERYKLLIQQNEYMQNY